MGMDWVDRYEHIAFGTIRLGDEAMSTRRGNVVFLEDLLDEATGRARAIIDERNPGLADKDEVAEMVGIGAVLFYFLMFNRMKDISFDWAAALNYEGLRAIISIHTPEPAVSCAAPCGSSACGGAECGALTEPEELALVKELARFGSVVASAKPAALRHSQVSLELCGSNGFIHRIRQCDGRKSYFWMLRTVIRNRLYLLGIRHPRM